MCPRQGLVGILATSQKKLHGEAPVFAFPLLRAPVICLKCRQKKNENIFEKKNDSSMKLFL